MMCAQSFRLLRQVASLCLLLTAFGASVSAQTTAPSQTADTVNLGQCGGSDTASSAFLRQPPSAGKLYVRLTNTSEPASGTAVYYQSVQDGICRLVGQATASFGQWTLVGDYAPVDNGAAAFIANGAALSAAPYAAVASVLIVPDSSVCKPVQSCTVHYQGYTATLQPQILTGATDEVAVYIVKPVAGVATASVSYYADNTFLYQSKSLAPVNRRYLRGGMHNIVTQVHLASGETLVINQTVDNGDDFADTKYLTSLFYRSRDKTVFFVAIGAVVATLLLVLGFARLLYKHREYKQEHGLEHYAPTEQAKTNDPSDNDHIVVG